MDLDADWIEEFNNKEKAYEGFYNKPVENIRIVFLYINGKNELISSKKFKLDIQNETISKNMLMNLLKKNISYNNLNYYPSYLLKFNIDLIPENIHAFLGESYAFNFLTQVNYMKEIVWEKTIKSFQSLNTLYIFMKRRVPNNRNSTKKIYISRKKLKKTRRKRI